MDVLPNMSFRVMENTKDIMHLLYKYLDGYSLILLFIQQIFIKQTVVGLW